MTFKDFNVLRDALHTVLKYDNGEITTRIAVNDTVWDLEHTKDYLVSLYTKDGKLLTSANATYYSEDELLWLLAKDIDSWTHAKFEPYGHRTWRPAKSVTYYHKPGINNEPAKPKPVNYEELGKAVYDLTNNRDETIRDVFDSLTEKQKTVVYYMIGEARKKGGDI